MQKTPLVCAALFGAALFTGSLSAADEAGSGRILAHEHSFLRAGLAWFEPVDNDRFDGEPGFMLGAGHNLGPHTVEVEVGYTEFSDDSGVNTQFEFIPVTLGYRYNLALGRRLSLGVGAGAGAAFTDLSVGGVGDEDTVLIASGVCRLGFTFNPSVGLSAGYRYLYVDDPSFFNGVTLEDLDTHVIDVSVDLTW